MRKEIKAIAEMTRDITPGYHVEVILDMADNGLSAKEVQDGWETINLPDNYRIVAELYGRCSAKHIRELIEERKGEQ